MALSPEIDALAKDMKLSGELAYVGGCGPFLIGSIKNELFLRNKCNIMSARIGEVFRSNSFGHVIVAARWAIYSEGTRHDRGFVESDRFDTGDLTRNRLLFAESLRGTIEGILNTGRKVTLIGPIPELWGHLPNAMLKARMSNQVKDFSLPYAEFAARQAAVLKILAELDEIPGVRVVYPHKLLCDTRRCRTSESGMPYYHDDDHLGTFGTKAIASVLAQALEF